MDLKQETLHALLSDQIDRARSLLKQPHPDLKLMAGLLSEIQDPAVPFDRLQAPLPQHVTGAISFTCGIGCEMCFAGFADKTSLYADYQHMSPEDFNKMKDWTDAAERVELCGAGETLESPHLPEILKTLRGKQINLVTSGIPLNREKARMLVDGGLFSLQLSFDGKTSLGHGAGKDEYINKFWEKVQMIQWVKRECQSVLPHLMMCITVNRENLDNLDEVFQNALENGVLNIQINLMQPTSPWLYGKSLYSCLETAQEAINQTIKKWKQRGLEITVFKEKELDMEQQVCGFVDRHLYFGRDLDQPRVCCGPVTIPLAIAGLSAREYWNAFPFRYFRFLHYHSEKTELPKDCTDCWLVNPKKEAERFQNSAEWTPGLADAEGHAQCDRARQLRSAGDGPAARALFGEVIEKPYDAKVRARAHFFLGEMAISDRNYDAAFSHMKTTVRLFYYHQMALAYLYLLLQLTEEGRELMAEHTTQKAGLPGSTLPVH